MSIELLSLCFYVMVTFDAYDVRANEGALKYFVLGAFSAGFFLLGIAFVYFATGSFLLTEVSELILSEGYSPYILVGLGFLIVALGFKVALVPFHMWTPDSYEAAPSAVTSYMATGVKIAAFAALFRFQQGLQYRSPG